MVFPLARPLHLVWNRPCARFLPSLQAMNLEKWDKLTQQKSLRSQLNFQSSSFLSRNFGSSFSLINGQVNTWPKTFPSSVKASAGGNNGLRSWDGGLNEQVRHKGALRDFFGGLLQGFLKLLGVVLLVSAVVIAGAPSFLSWPAGLKMVVKLANHTIPGTLSVASVSLGWTKPVCVEGITLNGVDGRTVLSIPKVESRAPLYSIVTGRTGLGDSVITAPVVDMQQDPGSGQPHLALALVAADKLEASKLHAEKKTKPPMPVEPSADVALTVKIKVPKGDLEVTQGTLTLPGDVAAVVGPKVFFEGALGHWATEESNELQQALSEHPRNVPLRVSLWSDRAQAEAMGFLNLRTGKVDLLRPMKAEMDLTPAVGKLYLARVNPLLGEVVGPAINEEDLPDITVYVAPTDLILPAEEYSIRIEPMKVTLAKGQLVDGVLSLLSKQDLAKGKSRLTMQTSAIEAIVNVDGKLACSRLDLLIADRVHVATWGLMDHVRETMQMTLAIPGSTLRDLLGLSKVQPNYYLKIPIRGTFERPQVDWMVAGKGIAQLTLRQQKGGEFFSSFFQQLETPDTGVPEPIDVLPWASQ